MSALRVSSLIDVNPGSFKWKVQVRVIRFWRGVSIRGEQFKGFNLLFLDDKNNRMHAFVPGNLAEEKEEQIKVGNIYNISNFTVKEYKPEDKFRCIHNDKQIIFTNFTQVEEIDDYHSLIQENMFDFFDLGDLKAIANENIYLTDVIGVLEKELPLRDFENRNGQAQKQLKFSLTDGRSTVNVTFWDALAEELEQKLDENLEFPRIIIIASAKISSWQDIIDISNVSATKFYINYNHSSVIQLREMLNNPSYSQHEFSTPNSQNVLEFSVEKIKRLGSGYIKKEVICDVQVRSVIETTYWYVYSCTSCYNTIEALDGKSRCKQCNKNVPYPDKKTTITFEAFDETGSLNIMLDDREVRTLFGKTAFELENEPKNENNFPHILKSIENKQFRIKIKLNNVNLNKECYFYLATDICEKPVLTKTKSMEANPEEEMLNDSFTEGSTSSYHLDGLSQLSFKSPEVTKKSRLRKLPKKYRD